MYWMKPNWLKKYFLNLAFFLESYDCWHAENKKKKQGKSQQIFSKENIGHVPHCIRFRVIQRFAHSSKELAIKIIKP